MDRYKDRPFLRLLDMYVIDAIGELSEKDADILKELTPDLSDAYNIEGSWQDIVKGVMQFPDNINELIKEAWQKNKGLAEQTGERANVGYFAMTFVDRNFV